MSFCYRNWEDECQAQAVERGSGGRPRGEPTAVVRLPLPLAWHAGYARARCGPATFSIAIPASAASSNVRPPAVFRRLRMIIWNTRSILMSS